MDVDQPCWRCVVSLEVRLGPGQGRRFPFDRHGTFLVGRAPEAHLCLADDRRVSLYHCLIEVNPPECFLTDLGSHNGTTVNGTLVRERLLQDGDVIGVGGTEIAVVIVNTAQPAGMAPGDVPTATYRGRQSEREGTAAEIAAPESVAGYEIVRQIGKGGMGVVYEATRKGTGQRVAPKLLIPSREITDRAVRFFLREASTLSQLKHKRIVRFHELGMAGKQFFLAMEYVETIDVRQFLADRAPPVRAEYYCGIACQVLDALRYAHAQGVVHRDVKPSNVLVSQAGRKLRTKLADFGLAKHFQNAGFSEFTRDGERRGTLPFMPPEQVIDSRYAQPAADIYSTGATLYYYLADRYAYDFAQSSSALATVLEQDPIPLASVRPDLPTGLAEVVHKALAKDPAHRFSSAEEMYRALYPYAKRSGR
jgi:serine/threonine-protein kinase